MSTTSTSSRTCRCRTAVSSTCCRKFPLSELPWFHDLFANLERFDYQPVGHPPVHREQWPDRRRQPQLRTQRDQALAVEIIRLQFAQIAMNHAIGCGSGYMSAIAPTGVCPATS